MFIVIEWTDGSGKGTQVKLLEEYFQNLWKKVKVLDYPRYGNPSTFFVEKYLNGGYGKDVSAKMASLFYALDRYDDSFDVKSYLSEYDIIISNRYTTANMIHQASKIESIQEVDTFLEWIFDLEYNICGIPQPDTVIFLDVPPVVSQKLVEKKDQREYIKWWGNKDIHEADEHHVQNAYQRALYVSKKYNWQRIECTKEWEILSREEITQKILNSIML